MNHESVCRAWTSEVHHGDPSRDKRGPGVARVVAERWQHSEGDRAEIQPRDTEVIVMLQGRHASCGVATAGFSITTRTPAWSGCAPPASTRT